MLQGYHSIATLEKERAHLISRGSALDAELDQCIQSKNELLSAEGASTNIKQSDLDNAQKLGFRPAIAARKDDLKLISGIGPFIEKQLNNLGIYTFEQISEFSSDTMEKIIEAIKFFPGRIERDHWVDQVRNFMPTKIN